MSYAKNRKAYHDYEVLETFEAGIVLNGDEVKSIKAGRAQLKGSFVDISSKLEPFINEAHISRYENSSRKEHLPTRKRKLLLNRKEIEKLALKLDQQGLTAIPLELYPKKGLIKLKIGLCRGKKLYDKRAALKNKDQERRIKQQLKNY